MHFSLDLIVNNPLLSYNMSHQSFKSQISSPRHKLEISIGFTLSNLVYQMLLTHLKFEGGVLSIYVVFVLYRPRPIV